MQPRLQSKFLTFRELADRWDCTVTDLVELALDGKIQARADLCTRTGLYSENDPHGRPYEDSIGNFAITPESLRHAKARHGDRFRAGTLLNVIPGSLIHVVPFHPLNEYGVMENPNPVTVLTDLPFESLVIELDTVTSIEALPTATVSGRASMGSGRYQKERRLSYLAPALLAVLQDPVKARSLFRANGKINASAFSNLILEYLNRTPEFSSLKQTRKGEPEPSHLGDDALKSLAAEFDALRFGGPGVTRTETDDDLPSGSGGRR